MKENVALAEFTTMKTGGNARFLFNVNNIEKLKEAILFAKENKLQFFILGGGSNTIISDSGFFGVVIKMEIIGIKYKKLNNNVVCVTVGAGVNWDDFVSNTVKNNLYGLENLSFIPGTVGASPIQNIGAYGTEVKNTISQVEVFDSEKFESFWMKNEECDFRYRESIFKTQIGKRFIITRVMFDLSFKGILNTSYPDVKQHFIENNNVNVTLQTLREAIVKIRKSKLPDINKIYSTGSFFKNPIVALSIAKKIEKKYLGLKYFPVKDSSNKNIVKLSAAWILDNVCNSKGFSVGNASVYQKHALVLINNNGKKTNDILQLAEKISSEVKLKTGIILKREVNFLE